jgi:hypothetical protein
MVRFLDVVFQFYSLNRFLANIAKIFFHLISVINSPNLTYDNPAKALSFLSDDSKLTII